MSIAPGDLIKTLTLESRHTTPIPTGGGSYLSAGKEQARKKPTVRAGPVQKQVLSKDAITDENSVLILTFKQRLQRVPFL